MIINQSILGDCRDVMRQLVADGVKVQTCVTSPPYYGLRDYGVSGQLGLEETPKKYIENMVEVFSCLWDLLADDGVLWLNIGDSYAGSGKGRNSDGSVHVSALLAKQGTSAGTIMGDVRSGEIPQGCKAKDLIGIPWMLAFALRDAGWYLRQDIIWSKPNPMPESVTDRCTKSHEYVFLLTKSSKYYFDNDAIKEKSTTLEDRPSGIERNRIYGYDSKENQMRNSRDSFKRDGSKRGQSICPNSPSPTHRPDRKESNYDAEFRNKRSVWAINTKPCKEAHFAVMPEELVENCIIASTKVGQIVFDPFMGSGTVGKVAQNLGRKWLGAELNPEYIKIQHKRTAQFGLELAA